MKKLLLIIIGLILLVGGGVLIVRARSGGSNQMAILKVTSTPTATIFLDNQNIGKTPFEQKVKTGEYTIKLIPETTVSSLVSWEGKIKLSANLLTFVNRDLGDSDLTSGGEILSLERIAGNKAELAVISTPDTATVTISAQEKGNTPLVLSDMDPGNYDLTVSAGSYKSRTIKVKTTSQYKLTAQLQLAMSGEVIPTPLPSPSVEPSVKATPKLTPKATSKASTEASASATPKAKASPPAKPYIQVLDTPTGFLNVREEPATNANILKQVHPGEYYSLLDENDKNWYKIEYEADKEGWVSGQYAQKFE